ncbi:DinB family protein [Pseudaestuariivita sp.]|uniref:DinB family protein n=1 Tax=Pseudaestuariivita sp. TaxID=2211669 RepID=UPI004058EC0C
MARYNAWQNEGLIAALETLLEAALREDRGAFFGSLLGTANHLLWGDLVWMSRFDGQPAPEVGIPGSPELCADLGAWREARVETDARILGWAEGVTSPALSGRLSWHSGALGREVEKPLALCVTHFFNHQTHHRGQMHAMLTAAGARPQDTDLFIMPDGEPEH